MINLLHYSKPERFRLYQEILTLAKEKGFNGFSGECAEAAIAINQILFNNEGQLLAALNCAFEEKNIILGHFCLSIPDEDWNMVCIDSDGYPKPDEDILSWGMLDEFDYDYQELALKNDIIFNENTATETSFYELSEIEALALMPGSGLDAKCQILLLCLKELNLMNTHKLQM